MTLGPFLSLHILVLIHFVPFPFSRLNVDKLMCFSTILIKMLSGKFIEF